MIFMKINNQNNLLKLSNKLINYRKKNAISAMQMAVQLGVSWVTYLNMEKGIISNKSRVKIENFFRSSNKNDVK